MSIKAQCKNCKDIIESKHRHDFVTCKCFKNSEENQGIFLDGGGESYTRYGGEIDNIILLKEKQNG